MTLADLDRIARTLEAAHGQIAARLEPLVRTKVEDARAHAGKVLTQRLKDTPDGRPTARVAAQNRSLAAAQARLDELLTRLCGPSVTSLEGKLRDARERLYRLAFTLHTPLIPEEVRIAPSPEPTQANLKVVRGFPLHGLDLRDEVGGAVASAGRTLRAAVHRAGGADTPAAQADDLFDGWEQSTIRSLMQVVSTVVGDAAVWCDGRAMRDLVHPEFREES